MSILHSFDTYAIVKRFIEGGFKEKQAELIVSTLAESRDYDLNNLATKADIGEIKSSIRELENKLESKISIEIERVRGEIANVRGEIKDSRNEMLKWFIGVAITSVGTITGLIALLLKYFIVQ